MFNADKFESPSIYKRNGQSVTLCSIRKCFIPRTPEEIIRQKFIRFLLSKWGIPAEYIEVEVPLSHHSKEGRGRIDILESDRSEQKPKRFIVVECKASHVPLYDDIIDQARNYARKVSASYIILTNGYKTRCFVNNEHCAEIELPAFFKDLARYVYKYKHHQIRKRPSLKELSYKRIRYIYRHCIGKTTLGELYTFILNLATMFRDDTFKSLHLPFETPYFTILKHYVRRMANGTGNSGAGSYPGTYRSFIISDSKGNHQILSMAMFGVSPGYTSLVVQVDNNDKKHNALQLNIDRYVRCERGRYTLFHNGVLTMGNTGPIQKHIVIDYVKSKRPDLVIDGDVVLGNLPDNELFTWKNAGKVICNLMHYALLRDDVRRKIRSISESRNKPEGSGLNTQHYSIHSSAAANPLARKNQLFSTIHMTAEAARRYAAPLTFGLLRKAAGSQGSLIVRRAKLGVSC